VNIYSNNTYCDVPAKPGVYVVCEDGRIRHNDGPRDAPFPTVRLAFEFAEYGHVCVANHTIITVGEVQ
jgi:hypothetical protein